MWKSNCLQNKYLTPNAIYKEAVTSTIDDKN